MDPYLEGEMWQDFHERLAHQISEQLLKVLPSHYVALLAKRYVLHRPAVGLLSLPEEHRVIYPDVHVAQTQRVREAAVDYETQAFTQPATRLPSLVPEEVPVLSVEVRDVANRRLVTVIEILSPVNKMGDGAMEYVEKRSALMGTSVHLLEIDLLRRGGRVIFEIDPPPADYYTYLSRFTNRPYTDVWPIGLRDRLPVLPVPLLPPDADVPLDLQRAVDACYDLVHYERLLDYTVAPPPPPLGEADAVWVSERVEHWVSRAVR
jgi:hypothetical protein